MTIDKAVMMLAGIMILANDDVEVPYQDPLQPLGDLIESYRSIEVPGLPLPRFSGGAVGYLSYEAVRAFEPRVPTAAGSGLGLPDGLWMLTEALLVFDHLARTIKAVAHVLLDEEEFLSPYGVRALSRVHEREPFRFEHDGVQSEVRYAPAPDGPTRFVLSLPTAAVAAGAQRKSA